MNKQCGVTGIDRYLFISRHACGKQHGAVYEWEIVSVNSARAREW